MKHFVVGIVTIILGLMACMSPTSEIFVAPTGTPLPTPTPMPTLIPEMTIEYGAEVSDVERQHTEEGLALGYDCLMQTLYQAVPAHVYVYSDQAQIEQVYAQVTGFSLDWDKDVLGLANEGSIFILSSRWNHSGFAGRALTLIHELFHVQQLAWSVGHNRLFYGEDIPVSGPSWIREGGAEYFAARCVSNAGLTDFNWYYKAALYEAAAETVPLQEMEGSQQWLDQGSYDLAFIAGYDLIEHYGWGAYQLYFAEVFTGSSWQAAFETAFGQTIDAYYASFDPEMVAPPATATPQTSKEP
jgi:hypothetical protein